MAKTREDIIGMAKNLRNDDNPENIRLVVCKFYGDNCCSMSSDPDLSCEKDECVMKCKNEYLSKIFTRPQEKWTPEFDLPVQRPKKKLNDFIEIGMRCNSCYMNDKCPAFEPNNMCGIEWEGEAITDPKDMIDSLIRMQYKRISRAQMFEEMDGGVPDANLSSEMDRLQGMIESKNNLNLNKLSININAQSQGNQGGGILSQLFGGGGNKEIPATSVEETPVLDISTLKAPEFNEELIEGKKTVRKK